MESEPEYSPRPQLRKKPSVSSAEAKYKEACKKLREQLGKKNELNQYAVEVFWEVRRLAHNPKSKISIERLTKILKTTTSILKGPYGIAHKDEAFKFDINKLHEHYSKIRAFPFFKLLAGAVLGLIGAAIVAASGILAAVSFGLAAPLSLFGMVFGASVFTGGIAIATGMTGASCLFFSGPLFASALRNEPLRHALKEFRTATKRKYHL